MSIRTGGVKRAYHGEQPVSSGGAGGPTIVLAAHVVGAGGGGGGGSANSGGGVGVGNERANQPVQQHVSGPRALYSSPVPAQPLTRSSRQ